MTKEELCHELNCYLERQIGNYAIGDLDNIVDEFFNANVVIPKGENRHPDADLFHRAIEDLNLRLESDRWAMTWKEDECIFYKSGVIDKKALIRYRIKPQEPVYEFQWYYRHTPRHSFNLTPEFKTLYEMKKAFDESWECHAINESKRERK